MFCIKCGNELGNGAKFCAKCGNSVNSVNDETPEITGEQINEQKKAVTEDKKDVKKKGKKGIIAFCAGIGILIVVVIIVLCANLFGNQTKDAIKNDERDENDISENMVSGNTVSGNTVSDNDAGNTTPLYYIENIGTIDVHASNYTPGTRVDGMDWDDSLFYWLEDISSSTTDGNIVNCVICKTQLRDIETGNLIQYEIYKDAANGEVYKIVSIEQLDSSLQIIDYYYKDGKPNFIFMREDSVYTPTYATIGKVGNRYYFNNDVMVRWRNILTPNVITEYTLTATDANYVQAVYSTLSADEQNAYNITETQMLNSAYNTYNAVANEVGIGLVEGRLVDTTGVAVSGMTVNIYRKSDNKLLYQTTTDAEGYFKLYTYLDNTECYLVVNEDETYKSYTINNLSLNASALGYSCNDIVMHKFSGDEYPVYVDIYSAIDVQCNDSAMTTGNVLQGATVLVREGAGTYEGDVLKTFEVDENGKLHTNLYSGIYTGEIQLDGYAKSYVEIEVAECETTVSAYMLPSVQEGETGVVLTWNDATVDLDLTAFTPYQSTNGDMAHIGGSIASDEYGNRLVSDNNAYCEVMYINTAEAGSYKLYVNNYTDSFAGNFDSIVLASIEVHVYIYDSNGFVIEYTFPAGQTGVVWEVGEINKETFTPGNRVYESVDGKAWWVESKENKRLVKEIRYYADGSICEWNEYDTHGNMVKEIHYYEDGSIGWWNEYEYEYDTYGNMVKQIRYNRDGSLAWWYEYEYDTHGNRVKEIFYYGDGSLAWWYEYEYDTHGNMVKKIDSALDWWYEYEYDAHGNMVKKIRYNSVDGSLDWWNEYEYDAHGNRVKEIGYYRDGSLDWWNEYEYDAHGNMVKQIGYYGDGSIREWSEYDTHGNRVKEIGYYRDGSLDWWYEYEYEYDTHGNMVKEICYYEVGAIEFWNEYEYDAHGNMVKQIRYNSVDGSLDWWNEYIYE